MPLLFPRARRSHLFLTFRIDPVCIAVGQSGAVTELLDRLGGFVVHLKERARPSPTGRVLLFRHFVHTSSTRRIGTRVVGDGTLEEDWGRQLGGIVGNRGRSGIVSSAGGTDEGFGRSGRQDVLPWVRRLVWGRRWHDRVKLGVERAWVEGVGRRIYGMNRRQGPQANKEGQKMISA